MTTDVSETISMYHSPQIPRTETNPCAAKVSIPSSFSTPPTAHFQFPLSPPSENLTSNYGSSAYLPGFHSMPSSPTGSSATYLPSSNSRVPSNGKSRSSTTSSTYCQSSNQTSTSHHPASLHLRRTKAFQHMGYRAFSSFLASDDDTFVVRKFGALHVRTILMLQDEIAHIEDTLDGMDQRCEEQEVVQGQEHMAHNGSFRGDRLWNEERYELMHRLVNLLDQYDRLVLSFSQLKKQPKASNRSLKNIKAWLKEYPQAVSGWELGFLSDKKQSDLVATQERMKSPLRTILENTRWFRRSKPFRLPPQKFNEYLRTYGDDKKAIFTDDDRIDHTINTIILFFGLVMLLVPAWGLNIVTSYTLRLAMITGFVALFLGLLLLVTPSKPFETMVGTAAYGVLLMVFMQIGK